MFAYYRKTLIELFQLVLQLNEAPDESDKLTLEIQERLIKKITYVEKKIRAAKREIASTRSRLRNAQMPRLTKKQSMELKKYIEYKDLCITEYGNIINVLREIGDSIAFTYLDNADIKPMIFKERSGFLSGKSGSRLERRILRESFRLDKVAILNDLTNCLRYGDMIVIDSDRTLILEAKSGKTLDKRGKRQIEKLETLTGYLSGDASKDIYEAGLEVVRVSLSTPINSHINELQRLIAQAYRHGESWSEVEKGLIYWVAYGDNIEIHTLRDAISRFASPPIACTLNESKYQYVGYVPIILSLRNPQHIAAFYEDSLVLVVVIDPSVIDEKFRANGIKSVTHRDADWAIDLESIEFPERTLSVSHYSFDRLFFEFLSLDREH